MGCLARYYHCDLQKDGDLITIRGQTYELRYTLFFSLLYTPLKYHTNVGSWTRAAILRITLLYQRYSSLE